MTMAGKKKAAFGGYAIDFKGQSITIEQLMGSKPVTPPEMTSKLWAHVKANGLGGKKGGMTSPSPLEEGRPWEPGGPPLGRGVTC